MRNSKDSIIVGSLLLSACAAVCSVPTVVQTGNDFVVDSIFLSTSELNTSHTQLSDIVAAQDSSLAFLSTNALASLESSVNLHNSTVNSATSLTAVPGALFMVLAGFFCISFVRDRRFWFAMLFGLASLGQDVFTALPHWAWQVRSKRKIERYAPNATYASELEDSANLRSYIEGMLDGVLRNTTLFLTCNNAQDKLDQIRSSR